MYVSGAEGVGVIDVTAHTLVDTYPVGPTAAVAITRDGRWLYAGNTPADGAFEVFIVDATTGQVSARLTVPGAVSNLVLSDDDRRLWVSHSARCQSAGGCTGSTGITVFKIPSHTIEATVLNIGGQVAVDASGGVAYLVRSTSIAALDTATFTFTSVRPAICCLSGMLELHPNGHVVYALGNEFGGFIGVADFQQPIDYATAIFVRGQALTNFDFQTDIAFRPDGSRAYLAGTIGPAGALFVMDTTDPLAPSLERVIDLEAQPRRIALARDGLRAYLLNDNPSVTVVDVDSGSVIAAIAVSSAARQIVVGPDGAPPSPSPVGVGSGGGCHMTSSEVISPGAALLPLWLVGFQWWRRSAKS